mmetsp:Transcript_60681/g.180526  ORF Transcript_60681/g.180526 Transcript_60681/m.180526 type:complete len:454 (-) Transcript_60681:1343-2704(-)
MSYIRVATGCAPGATTDDCFRFTWGDGPYTLHADGSRSPRTIVETYEGLFKFNTEAVCWYLDSAFCSHFHSLKRAIGNPQDAKTLVYGLLLGVAACAACILLVENLTVIAACFGYVSEGHRRADQDHDGKLSAKERCGAAMEELAEWNPLTLSLVITAIISPSLVAFKIIEPCWSCYDFEAAAIHEIGHFLGLGHPDNIPENWLSSISWVRDQGPGLNSYNAMLAAGGRINASNCNHTWDYVRPGVPPGADLDESGTYPVRNSMMEALTQHNPKACLTDDDVEALATLYPDCSDTSVSVAVCHKTSHNIGLVRVMVYVLSPLLIALFIILVFSGIMHSYTKKEMEDARAEASDKTKQIAVMRFKGAVNKFKSGRCKQTRGRNRLLDDGAHLKLNAGLSAANVAANRDATAIVAEGAPPPLAGALPVELPRPAALSVTKQPSRISVIIDKSLKV